VVTAALYLWGLDRSGWANSFYSAAVQAGTRSWKAMFYGSFDSANFITVDKPPAALWVMDISARLFGLNSWSILVPQALEGVASVALLYSTVRRWFGTAAGLVAGLGLALTPVAALMFRYNNPDALLTLLLVASAYCLVRATEKASSRWLALAGALVGLAFLAKLLAALLVVPAFGLVYLVAAPTALRRRVIHLLGAGVALAAAGLWWPVVVTLVPSGSRPYIGGSQNNSIWNVMFGYNGFGRLTGNEAGSVGGGATAGSRWGLTGLARLFNGSFGGQASWLLPAALIVGVGAWACIWRAPRTDRSRAALLLWGGWLAVTGAVFSFGQGIIHPYYTVALAPAIAALVAIGGKVLWDRRETWWARGALAVAVAVSGIWSAELLRRSPGWNSWLIPAVLVAALVVVILAAAWSHLPRRATPFVAAAAVVVMLAAPAAYTLATVDTAYAGAIPSAGPAVRGGGGFGAGGRPGGAGGAFPGGTRRRFGSGAFPGGGVPGGGFAGGGFPGAGGFGGGPFPGFGGSPSTGTGGSPTGPVRQPGGGGFGPGGGILNPSTPSAALTQLLKQDSSRYTWVAATVGANSAAGYQLATDDPVMAIGGFNGTDPAPTLAQFQSDVAAGKVHYFIGGGRGGFGPGGGSGGSGNTGAQIASWVEQHFTAQSVGGVTLYDLSSPITGGG
jgi:4-amino-4-deoxy-L-arabinose transferase-like glycosyltransferase